MAMLFAQLWKESTSGACPRNARTHPTLIRKLQILPSTQVTPFGEIRLTSKVKFSTGYNGRSSDDRLFHAKRDVNKPVTAGIHTCALRREYFEGKQSVVQFDVT